MVLRSQGNAFMAVTVGFVSEKGGVGKTTTCYHVAIALQRYHGLRVLVVDADYQRGGISGRFFPDVIEAFGAKPARKLVYTTNFSNYTAQLLSLPKSI